MRIGIVGAENSHAGAIAKIVNVEKRIRGAVVTCIWGESDAFARAAAEAGAIAEIVRRPGDMLGRVDAVIVDHRHAKFHLSAALPFVEAGVRTFVDKPFCYRAKEGRAFLRVARKRGVAVTSFSVLPEQGAFGRFMRKLEGAGRVLAGATYGPCDLRSKWGGVFFYGIHQVDMALKAFGYGVKRVAVRMNGNGAVGELLYGDGVVVTMHLVKEGLSDFAVSAATSEGVLHASIGFDKSMYLSGVRKFVGMFRTGVEPEEHEHMLRPVEVLEALERSVKSGGVEKVGR